MTLKYFLWDFWLSTLFFVEIFLDSRVRVVGTTLIHRSWYQMISKISSTLKNEKEATKDRGDEVETWRKLH